MDYERIIIIKGKTRLETLVERFNSKSQAKFYIEHGGGNYSEYEKEHNDFYNSFTEVQKSVTKILKTTVLERSYLSTFLFDPTDLIVVVGQDGLVANTGKYVGSSPIVAINPDQSRYSGNLLPFSVKNYEGAVLQTINNKSSYKQVTLAQAQMNDGQRLLAFNDLFIGKADHTSARYKLNYEKQEENQSSSGLIISTGAGSTGWLSSVFNELNGLFRFIGQEPLHYDYKMEWDDNRLCFIVREPYVSPYTKASIVAGFVDKDKALHIESNMPENGVIFSDGIADDYLIFNSGSTLTIGTADEKVRLVF